MNGSVIREPSRSLKEQFSRSTEAWKEQSDPIFRFWAEGDWWGFPFFSLCASRYFGDKETLCFIGRYQGQRETQLLDQQEKAPCDLVSSAYR